MQRSARERNVRNVAHAFVRFARGDQVGTAAGRDLPRLLQIQQCRAEGVDIAVARAKHPVVEQQPALRGLDGNGARADLHALPRRNLERRGRHHMTVAAPELHVGALRIEDVPEGRVTRVARTRQHREPAPDLARKQNPVAVIGKKCVFKLVERLEVIRPRNADRRPVVAVAPRNVVFVADLRNARIVAVDPLADLGVRTLQPEVGLLDLPPKAVDRKAYVDAHPAVRVVAPENARIVIFSFFEGNDRRVEDRIRRRKRMTPDDRVRAVTPHHLFGAGGTVLPRHIGLIRARNFQCIHINYLSFGLSS